MSRIEPYIIPWCWLGFLIYWVLNARKVKATAEQQSRASGMVYRLPLLIAGVLLWLSARGMGGQFSLTPRTGLTRFVADNLCVLGLAVAIWARRTLAGNWSSYVTFKTGHELIQSGPYRYVRHPIYTGLLMMWLGTTVAIGFVSSWIAFFIACAALCVKWKQEEALMLRHFPNDYPAYRARVKAIIPFIL